MIISIMDGLSSLGAAAAGVDAPTGGSGCCSAAAAPTSWIKLPLGLPGAAEAPPDGFAIRPSSTSVLRSSPLPPSKRSVISTKSQRLVVSLRFYSNASELGLSYQYKLPNYNGLQLLFYLKQPRALHKCGSRSLHEWGSESQKELLIF